MSSYRGFNISRTPKRTCGLSYSLQSIKTTDPCQTNQSQTPVIVWRKTPQIKSAQSSCNVISFALIKSYKTCTFSQAVTLQWERGNHGVHEWKLKQAYILLTDSCQPFITPSLMIFSTSLIKVPRRLSRHDRELFSNHDTSIPPSYYMPFIQSYRRAQSLWSVWEQ